MKDSERDFFGCVGLLALLVVLPFVSYCVYGFVLAQLWSWFVVPFGVMALSIPHAVGVSLVVGFLTHQTSTHKDDRTSAEKWATAIVSIVVSPGMVLFIGWVAHSFMG